MGTDQTRSSSLGGVDAFSATVHLHFYEKPVFRPLEPKPLVNTSRLVTNAFPNQGSVIQDTLVRCRSLPKTKKAARSGPHLADSLTSYYLALAGGTMPFIRRYSTI